MRRHAATLPLVVLALVCIAGPAFAQAAAVAAINSIPDAFQTQVRGMEGPLRTLGLSLLTGIGIIELTVAIAFKAADGGGLQDMLHVAVKQGFIIGLFVFFTQNAPEMCRSILLWWTNAGNTGAAGMGGAANLSPGNIVGIGMNVVTVVWDKMSWTAPEKFVVLAFSGVILLYVFAELTAAMVMNIVSGYFFIAWSALLMGFGGNAFTRDIAINQIRLAAGIGAERFVLICIIGLGEGFMRTWSAQLTASNFTIGAVLPMIFCPLIMLRLASSIPAKAHSLLTGHQHPVSYSSPIARMLGGATSAAGGAAAAVGGAGAAVGAAVGLAKQQAGSGGGMAGAMQIASMTARNLGTAAASDVGKRLAGNYGAQNGHLGFRMASAMRQETAQIGQARTAASQSVQARVTQAATQARRTGP